MKLVIATPLYPPEPGGPATYAKLIAEGLTGKGIETVVVKFSDVRKWPPFFRHVLYERLVRRALIDADAVLALDPVSTGFPASEAAKKLGKPFYVKIVGDYAWEQGVQRFGIQSSLDTFVHETKVPLPVRMMREVETLVAKRARRIIVPSNYMKRIIEAWGISGEKIEVIYNAPPELKRIQSYERPSDVPQGPYLVSIARLVPWKGIDGVLRALARLKETHPDFSLVIVGDGPEEVRLRALAHDLGLSSGVVFVGRKSQEDAPAYLAHAEALILNTGYEGFSHLILEAFLLKVPVITTPVGGNREQVEDGVSGLLVPYQDSEAMAKAMERIRFESGLKERLVEGALKKLSSFGGREMLLSHLARVLASTP